MSFTTKFGNTAISPAQPQYETILLSANIALTWPLEAIGGVPYVAAQIDVSATAGGLSIAMPPADQGSTGIAAVITNIGANSFTLTDTDGNPIQIIAPSVSYIITLTDNSTVDGEWRSYQLAATTSSADAAALAGNGLQAFGSQLQTTITRQNLSTNTMLTTGYRATAVVWTGGAGGTLQMDSATTLTSGWWCWISNHSATDPLTLSCSGSDKINGQATLTLPLGDSTAGQYYSTLVVCANASLLALSVPTVTPITGGGTGATDANTALSNLGGTAIGISIFTAPNAAAILAILGIQAAAITQSTINSDTAIDNGSNGIAYVCTTSLNLPLTPTNTLTTSFFFLVDAQGGAVTFVPDPADQIAGQAAGTNYVIPRGSSLLMVTDASGNWWPFFLSGGTTIPWAIGGGTGDVITANYTPTIITTPDGLLLAFRAPGTNVTTTPTFQPVGAAARTVTKGGGAPLAQGDIINLGEYFVRYNSTHTRYELLNPSTNEPPWAIAGGAADAITATYNPPVPVLYDGLLVGVRAGAANATTTPTFSPNALTAHTITKLGGTALIAGDIAGAGAELLLRLKLAGPNWELLNPASIGSGQGYNAQIFIVNGTFTIPAGATTSTLFKFTGMGAGGGSGGAGTTNGAASAGGGGGGGFIAAFSGFTAGQVITVVVGVGGIAGTAGGDGGDGSLTSLTYAAATFASGGPGLHSTGTTSAGPTSLGGGAGGSGNVPGGGGLTRVAYQVINGQYGGVSISHTTTALAQSGYGGGSIFGPGQSGDGGTAAPGSNNSNPGTGACGAVRLGGSDEVGGAGSAGQLLIEWWL